MEEDLSIVLRMFIACLISPKLMDSSALAINILISWDVPLNSVMESLMICLASLSLCLVLNYLINYRVMEALSSNVSLSRMSDVAGSTEPFFFFFFLANSSL